MPFKIVRKGNGYAVKNMDSGKEYSKHPMTLLAAEAQLRVLNSLYKS
jgi:hypothetical protein